MRRPRRTLARLAGEAAAARLWALPGTVRPAPSGRRWEVGTAVVRRYVPDGATRPWVTFHADMCDVSVNVALSTDRAGDCGGRLLALAGGGAVRVVAREEGTAHVHASDLVHGVSASPPGCGTPDARYALCLFFRLVEDEEQEHQEDKDALEDEEGDVFYANDPTGMESGQSQGAGDVFLSHRDVREGVKAVAGAGAMSVLWADIMRAVDAVVAAGRAAAGGAAGCASCEHSVLAIDLLVAPDPEEGQGAANSGKPRLRPWIIDVLEQPGFEPYASEDYPASAAADADAFVEDLVNLLLARATHNSTDARSKLEEVEEAARFGFEWWPIAIAACKKRRRRRRRRR